MTPLERITERVSRNGDVNEPTTLRPLLTLAEFFDGNDTPGSIGCNLSPVPEPTEMHELLGRIAERWNVADVRVEITAFDDPAWPFSDTVWIITSADPEEIAGWFKEEMRPDACSRGWTASIQFEPCAVPEGMQPIACWWD